MGATRKRERKKACRKLGYSQFLIISNLIDGITIRKQENNPINARTRTRTARPLTNHPAIRHYVDTESVAKSHEKVCDVRTVGFQVHPSHGVCYIPYDGKELSFQAYDILVSK
jgi:hypothetical protein